MTGGRILRVGNLLKDNFCLTYGDGVIDLNIKESSVLRNFNYRDQYLQKLEQYCRSS